MERISVKIGIVGWYGHNNAGDDRLLYCLKDFFKGHEILVFSVWSGVKQRMAELNECDFILIGGGGMFLRGVGQHVELFHHLKKPFGLVGISVEEESIGVSNKGLSDLLRFLADNAKFIYVRDKESGVFFEDHSDVIVGPDLTFLRPFEIAKEIESDICGLNVMNWHFWHFPTNSLCHKTMVGVSRFIPSIQRYYPFKMWSEKETVDIVKRNFQEIVPITLYSERGRINDVSVLSRYFKEVPESFDDQLYHRARFFIGMHFHSLIFATQCGIPFLSLTYQPKSKRLCDDLGTDMLSVDIYAEMDEIEQRIEFLKKEYESIRNNLLIYREKAMIESQRIMNQIYSIVEGESAQH
jgi:polysaccharide pyruvyl transferase WcaK-like protein